jgi:hypothetical protein
MSTPTRVSRVTVHPNGALIVRTGRAEPGPVHIDGLPLLLTADTLRVRPAEGSVRDLRERCAISGGGERTAPNAAELATRYAQRVQLEDALSQLNKTLQIWRTFTPADPLIDPRGGHIQPNPDALLAMDATAFDRIEVLETQRAALEDQRDTLDRDILLLQRTPADPEPPRFTRGLGFTLVGDGPTDFELEYFVPAARWVPTYRIDLDDGQARLRTDALVAQATGEDWTGAAVALATADLARETTVPERMAWRIGTAQTPPRPAFRPLPEGLDALFNGYDRARRAVQPAPEPAPMVEAASFGAGSAMHALGGGGWPEEPEASYDLADEVAAPPPIMRSMAPPPPMPSPSMPAPQARPAPARSRGGAQKSKKRMAAPPRPGGAPPPPVAPPPALRPRLRHPYLSLAGPDDPKRGTLRPLDPTQHLWRLLGDRPVVGFDALQRALDALQVEAARMHGSPLPPGTRPLSGESWHHLHHANGLHSVPADGQWHRVAVRADQAPAQLTWRAVPSGGEDVYRFCKVDTPAGVPFPTGPLQVYIDGLYRVSATLTGDPGGPALNLNLGVETGVRIVERTTRTVQSEKGLMTHTTVVDHTVTTRVRSALEHPVQVHLHDRLPRSHDDEKDLTVSLQECSPRPKRTDLDAEGKPLRGGLRWRITLPPGEVATVTWRYRLEFPAKSEVVGGNRRD